MSCLDSTTSAAPPGDQVNPGPSAPALDRGTAGRSVTREAERRSERHRRQQDDRLAADREWRSHVKAEHPIAGRILTAITPKVQDRPAPQHVRAWVTGAPGEQKVGATLDAIEGIIVLHDRHKPRSRTNIDHIAVTPAGVWVIDTKVRAGKKLEFRNKGGLLGRDERLIVGGRDETKLVDDMAWQVQTVYEACADLLGGTAVKPALCFVEATIGLLDRRPWTVRGVVVCWRAVLPDLLLRAGPFDERRMTEIAERIAGQLPAA
jgi:Nuclease-related domain